MPRRRDELSGAIGADCSTPSASASAARSSQSADLVTPGRSIRAIQNGFSVTFTTADGLIEKMRRDEQNPNRRSHRRKFMSAAVLIIDELGFQTLDRKDAHLLFKVISYRYERGATIITSN